MKKQLLCTSAIALGVAAAPAAAQDWNLDWGGYYLSHVGISDVSGTAAFPGSDFDGMDVYNDGEIHFTPSITLDNGMTFGVTVEFEATNSGGAIVDETYMSISSDTFGRLDLGNENSAGYKLMVGAPGVTGLPINSPSISAFIPRTGTGGFRQAQLSSYTEVGGNNDVSRITYYTPDFNGLTVGVSYAAMSTFIPFGNGGGNNNFAPNRNALILNDIFDIGVNYSQSFGSTDVTVAARWGTADTNIPGFSDPQTWGIGAQFGFNNFTVGGSYAENDNGAPFGIGDQEGWSLGATYDAAGPWAFEVSAKLGEVDNGPFAPSSDYEAYRVGANRTLGPGVSWDIAYTFNETNNGAVFGNPNFKGNLLSTGINLSF